MNVKLCKISIVGNKGFHNDDEQEEIKSKVMNKITDQ